MAWLCRNQPANVAIVCLCNVLRNPTSYSAKVVPTVQPPLPPLGKPLCLLLSLFFFFYEVPSGSTTNTGAEIFVDRRPKCQRWRAFALPSYPSGQSPKHD